MTLAVEKERSPREPLNIHKPRRGTEGSEGIWNVDLGDSGAMKAKREGVLRRKK